MKILILDDVKHVVNDLGRILSEIDYTFEIYCFTDYDSLLEDENLLNTFDVAFLDIQMPDCNGIDVAKKLQEYNEKINIIFITGYMDYMRDAFDLYASAYLEKPIRKEKVKVALNHLRFVQSDDQKRKLRIQCFGNFEAFVDNVPLHFYRSKSKELLAFLVDRRGAVCDSDMIIGNLWPDDAVTNNLKSLQRMVVSDLFRSLADYGFEDIIFRDKNGLSLDVRRVDCDYYHFLNGNNDSINQFRGEYMSQYSFAESTKAYLERRYYD